MGTVKKGTGKKGTNERVGKKGTYKKKIVNINEPYMNQT